MVGQRILRRPEVEVKIGLRKSSLYKLLKRGEFPQPVKLGPRAIGWYEHEVDKWIERLPRVEQEKIEA